ncbi:hypothetical protein BC629DRAFT_1611780 [Irpex lacteus]|nr:hypothetical protein BC629DRAFT_1611780 [Irpex lacteus]
MPEEVSTAPSPIDQQPTAKAKDKSYQFCPPAHRVAILRLFAKHACQHPLLPDRHGRPRSSHDIRRDAVAEIYWHCHRNNLTEVWAYLWNNWYARDRWSLWARSSHPTCISNHRTTMMVEALWRNLKRLVLRNFNRPRLDLALFALVHGSIPPYRKTLSEFLKPRPGGRPKGLSNMQEAFKKAWRRLETVPIKGTYITDTDKWTCDCGTQKYHAYLLCKHLVQAVGQVPTWWWSRVHRFYTPPFYCVPDGDQWTERLHESDRPCIQTTPAAEGDSDADEVEDLVRGRSTTPTPASEPSSISSSPAKPPPTGRDGLMRTRAGGGAGFELEDETERECDTFIEKLERAVEIFKEQRQYYNQDPRFMRNGMKAFRKGIQLVDEVNYHETRLTIPVTNGSGSSRQRLPTSLIGYKYTQN